MARCLVLDVVPPVLLLGALLVGCADSDGAAPLPPRPEPAIHNPVETYNLALTAAPVTSSVPHGAPVWARAELLAYVPHPSVRLTQSVLRPGEWNTPAQRLLEEIVLARPDADSRLSPFVVGPPPGWAIVVLVDRITLAVEPFDTSDQNGEPVTGYRRIEAEGLTDPVRRVIWVRAADDAVTPEGEPLAPAYAHELRHAHVYEAALKRGATQAEALRESLEAGHTVP